MSDKMVKMPKIAQFKDVIRVVKERAAYAGKDDNGESVYDGSRPIPTLKFKGTIKLHGTNAAIVYNWEPLQFDYAFHAQSKNRVITPEDDNLEFASFVYAINTEALLASAMRAVGEMDYTPNNITIFGEWCGGSIQSGVALNGLDKMFVIFAVKIDGEYVDNKALEQISYTPDKVYNVLQFPSYDIEIDFSNPHAINNKLGEITLAVEDECPVAKAFDKEGIGEGVVWKCTDAGYNDSDFWFKVKGPKHAKGSKVKTLAPVDIERIDNIKVLVEELVTERRLEQGFEYFTEMNIAVERKNIPIYLKWLMDDVVSEELLTITENGFTVKDVSKEISNKARLYYFEREAQLL